MNIKKILLFLFLLLAAFSCFNKTSQFQKQYGRYKKEILNSLEKGKEITEEQRKEILKIFTIDYKGKDSKTFLIGKNYLELNDEDKKQAVKDIAQILIIANYKTELSEIKRGISDKVFNLDNYDQMISEMDTSINLYLATQNVTKILKDSPVNDYGKDLSIDDYLKQLRHDIGLN